MGQKLWNSERILEYADPHSLVIANIVIRKRDSHLVCFYSGYIEAWITTPLSGIAIEGWSTIGRAVGKQHRPLICTLTFALRVSPYVPERIKW